MPLLKHLVSFRSNQKHYISIGSYSMNLASAKLLFLIKCLFVAAKKYPTYIYYFNSTIIELLAIQVVSCISLLLLS
jgi:hypothetical protein